MLCGILTTHSAPRETGKGVRGAHDRQDRAGSRLKWPRRRTEATTSMIERDLGLF